MPIASLGLGQAEDAQLRLALAIRQEALRAEPHHDQQDHAVDQEVVLGRVGQRWRPSPIRLAEVGQERLVDIGQRDGADDDAPDVPDATEDDHDQDEDRRRELEEVRRRGAEVGRLEGAGDAREARPEREREELRPDGVDAHHLGRGLVLADGHPRSPDARELEVARDDDGDGQQEDPEIDGQRPGARVEEDVEERQERWIDRVDPLHAAGQVDVLASWMLIGPRSNEMVMLDRFLKTSGTISPKPRVTIAR